MMLEAFRKNTRPEVSQTLESIEQDLDPDEQAELWQLITLEVLWFVREEQRRRRAITDGPYPDTFTCRN